MRIDGEFQLVGMPSFNVCYVLVETWSSYGYSAIGKNLGEIIRIADYDRGFFVHLYVRVF